MALIHALCSWWSILAAAAIFIATYLYAYFVTYDYLRGIPSPFPAQFSNLWLLYVVRKGERYSVMDEVHKKLGPVVRIQPNHTSIADDAAIPVIYGHGNGFLKS